MKKFLILLLLLLAVLGFTLYRQSTPTVVEPTPVVEVTPTVENTPVTENTPATEIAIKIHEDDEYDTKDEVALYIHTFGKLPNNYMTKKEAREKGWKNGPLWKVVPDKCIGGDVFSNFEENLPVKKGRTYYECDIGTLGKKSRGAKRIIFSNDGLVYYTKDHYETFELLYGDEE